MTAEKQQKADDAVNATSRGGETEEEDEAVAEGEDSAVAPAPADNVKEVFDYQNDQPTEEPPIVSISSFFFFIWSVFRRRKVNSYR